MKRITWLGVGVVGLIVLAAIFVAIQKGQTSPLIAQGKIFLSPDLEKETHGGVLFITVFDQESQMPMPFGAYRQTIEQDAKGVITEFTLTKESLQIMQPGKAPPKILRLKARIDLDGIGGPDLPGDLIGSVENVGYGTRGINITINSKVP